LEELLEKSPSVDKCLEQFKIFLENAYEYKEELNGSDFMRKIEQSLLLESIDLNWQSHLEVMDDLRQTSNLRAYGQKDPLVEYKNEGFELFKDMLEQINTDLYSRILRVNAVNTSEREYQNVDLNVINTAVESIKNIANTAGFRPAGDILTSKSARKKLKRKNKRKNRR